MPTQDIKFSAHFQIFEENTSAILAYDKQGKIIYANTAASELFNFTLETLFKLPLQALMSSENTEAQRTIWYQDNAQFQITLLDKNQNSIQTSINTQPGATLENTTTDIIVATITPLIQKTTQVESRHSLLESLFNGINIAVGIKCLDSGEQLFTNRYLEHYLASRPESTGEMQLTNKSAPDTNYPLLNPLNQPNPPYHWQGYCEETKRWFEVYEKAIPWYGHFVRLQIAIDTTKNYQNEQAIHEQRDILRSVIDENPNPVILKDSDGKYLLGNQAVADLYSLTPDELIGKDEADFLDDPSIGEFFRQNVQQIMREGKTTTVYEDSFDVEKGEYRTYMSLKKPFKNLKGESQILIVANDITDLRRTEKMLFQYKKIIETSHDMLAFIDSNQVYLAANQRYLDAFDMTLDELVGKTIRDIMSSADAVTYQQYIKPNLEAALYGEHAHYEEWITLPNLGKKFLDVNYYPYIDENGIVEGVVINASDLTERKLTEQKLEHLALHDTLTDLPNRRLFNDRLVQALKRSEQQNQNLAILFIDLDRFKIINDSLGHKVGDGVLITLAQRLTKAIHENDTLARSGGDEFLLLIENYESTMDIIITSEMLMKSFNEPMTIDGNEIYITGSIGISLYPDDAKTAEELIQLADTAMYQAKRTGRNNFQFSHQELRKEAFERFFLENHLRAAIEKNEFTLYYQPQINIDTNTLCGAEVLLRWEHSELGMVAPDRFIPIAEETRLIIPIGEWVLDKACKTMKKWLDAGVKLDKIAVNIAGPQLLHSDLKETVQNTLDKHQLEAKYLELEVTESYLMEDKQSVATILSSIRDMGISISVDDFGTGYSSLSYLQKLPISKLKIDQTFVKDVPGDEDDKAIIKTIIALSENLKMRLIAEGVETKEQATYLLENGCDQAQGFLYAKPMNEKDFLTFIEEKFEPQNN